jgi:hypothetical protein
MVAQIWADCDPLHVLIAGARIKTVHCHLTVTDLAALVAQGAVAAGPSPQRSRKPSHRASRQSTW